MIIKCGIDLVSDARIEKLLESESFIERVFLPSERIVTARQLVGIFALKEATVKALELPADSWLSIEIMHTESGKTNVVLADSITQKHIKSIDSSVSHEAGFTIGYVTMLLEQNNTEIVIENDDNT